MGLRQRVSRVVHGDGEGAQVVPQVGRKSGGGMGVQSRGSGRSVEVGRRAVVPAVLCAPGSRRGAARQSCRAALDVGTTGSSGGRVVRVGVGRGASRRLRGQRMTARSAQTREDRYVDDAGSNETGIEMLEQFFPVRAAREREREREVGSVGHEAQVMGPCA